MPLMPFHILGMWLSGLLAFAIVGGGAALIRQWYRRSYVWDDRIDRYIFAWQPGFNEETAFLVAGLLLLLWAIAGGVIVRSFLGLLNRSVSDEPDHTRGGEVRRLQRPDGTELQVELYGPEDGPPIVLTHGWGANSTEWYYLKKQWANRYRLIVWDLPGLGRSSQPEDRNFRLEKLAGDLEAVLSLAGERPAVLLGHSIGGMTILTFCHLFPEALGRRVAALVLVHTTYTNPVRTTSMAGLYTALEKPVLVPLLHLTIALWPLVWLMTWMSYLNGSTHVSTKRNGFAGTETSGQLEFAARFQPHASPAVLARGMFGMLEYDATGTLPTITVPTLVVTGDRDKTTPLEANTRISRDVPNAELATLEPARHMGLIEHHERFGTLVSGFIDAHSHPRGARTPTEGTAISVSPDSSGRE